MNAPPRRAVLPDGRRCHFQHGPIDLVLQAFGADRETKAAYGQAWARFETILEELVGELPALRAPLDDPAPAIMGPVAAV